MINKHIISAAAILLFGGAFMANAQTEIAVSGTVTDSYGNPLPGVIVSANSKDLYITDKNGQYTATAGSSDELTFSLVGYKQKTAKATATDAKIVLEDDGHGLAELVNLGYSKEYREVLSDAVATTSGDLLGKSLHTRLQQTLSGRLSGLTTIENTFEPTYEELSMYIRGLSTVHGVQPVSSSTVSSTQAIPMTSSTVSPLKRSSPSRSSRTEHPRPSTACAVQTACLSSTPSVELPVSSRSESTSPRPSSSPST